MSKWKDVAHFLYGLYETMKLDEERGFWYADPLREIKGLTDEQLLGSRSEQLAYPLACKAYWLLIKIAHTALHVGRIQLL